jgi:hypothetical protein
MLNTHSQRCPFLLGNPENSFFDAIKSGGRKATVSYKCCHNTGLFDSPNDDFPIQHGCSDGNYTYNCQCYASKVLELSIKIPINCPLCDRWSEKCNDCGEHCDNYWLDPTQEDQDYRTCEIFSTWFWEQAVKNQTKEDKAGGT